MSFGGHVAASINSLKNNKALLKKRKSLEERKRYNGNISEKARAQNIPSNIKASLKASVWGTTKGIPRQILLKRCIATLLIIGFLMLTGYFFRNIILSN